MYRRILAIADIHGEWKKFMSLYGQIGFDKEQDLLIFLGDYVDRGPEPCRVLDWMIEHREEPNIIMLRGNHEQMMLDDFKADYWNEVWQMNGGNSTLLGMKKKAETEPDIKEKYTAFIESLPYSYQIEAGGQLYFFCHAGVMPGIPLDKQSPEHLLWVREVYFNHYDGEAVIVTGHTPTCYLEPDCYEPIQRGNMVLLDTGSFMPRGRISCMDVLTRQVWQSEMPRRQKEEGWGSALWQFLHNS